MPADGITSIKMTRHESASKKTVSVTYLPRSSSSSASHRLPGFTVYADPDELDRWRQDHGSVPMSQVLERMQVYVTRGATRTGIHEAPSKQMLYDVFNTDSVDDVIETILEDGEVHNGDKI